ncbi:MAG TPA: FtsX-like permease family protein [Gemmatimonadetes bacterium]|nr:FtsX-like permease family protein [Gemmatimonadota bacterium]
MKFTQVPLGENARIACQNPLAHSILASVSTGSLQMPSCENASDSTPEMVEVGQRKVRGFLIAPSDHHVDGLLADLVEVVRLGLGKSAFGENRVETRIEHRIRDRAENVDFRAQFAYRRNHSFPVLHGPRVTTRDDYDPAGVELGVSRGLLSREGQPRADPRARHGGAQEPARAHIRGGAARTAECSGPSRPERGRHSGTGVSCRESSGAAAPPDGPCRVAGSLGAQRTDVLGMVVRQGMVVSAGGVILGVLGAVAATRLISSWLYGIEATDPVTFAGVSLVLVGITLLATYVPARRAARVDPLIALRSE